MKRSTFYNKYRAFRVISQRHEEHPVTWEPWMVDFPIDRLYIPDASVGIVAAMVLMSERWKCSEQERREILISRTRQAIRRNLQAVRQEEGFNSYEAILDSRTI